MNDVIINNPIIFKLLIPLFLNKDNSLLSTILIKKNCVAIIKIKGKISYSTEGKFSRVNKIG